MAGVDSTFDGALTPGVTERRVLDRATGMLRFVKTQVVSDLFFDAVRASRENVHRSSVLRYRGSIPILLAQRWARECGSAIGTRAFNEFAHRRMKDGAYSKLRGD